VITEKDFSFVIPDLILDPDLRSALIQDLKKFP